MVCDQQKRQVPFLRNIEKIQFYENSENPKNKTLRIHNFLFVFNINKDTYREYSTNNYNLEKVLDGDCVYFGGYSIKYYLALEVPLEALYNKGLKIMSWDTEDKIKEKIYYSVMENLSEFFPEEFI